MNPDTSENDATFYYYESDYPSATLGRYPENFDAITKFQGIAHDVARYEEIASRGASSILELCCGSGRVAIPLARRGYPVVAVDIAGPMLARFKQHLAIEPHDVSERIELVQADVTSLSLNRSFDVVLCAFNSLLLMPELEAQLSVLKVARAHLARTGTFALDVVNPLALKIEGNPVPTPFFTRRNPQTGNMYTRFAMSGPFDAEHRQRMFGYYDELDANGIVHRRPYSFVWRPLFRFELELMLRSAGLSIATLEAGHQHEPFASALSPRMFIEARHTDERG
ncbi:MAG: class I SAM-dependent methyltransferase [Deltaproteobacteria bacterium]|nr:class I SAM-dependent methyltransferase [Deltaproteobacteria bacterium]